MPKSHISISISSHYELFLSALVSIYLGEVMYVVFEILIEYFKNYPKYKNPKDRLFAIIRQFNLKNQSLVFVVILTVAFSVETSKLFNVYCLYVTFLTSIFSVKNFLEPVRTYEIKKFLRENTGLDYGSGMASNYFHGFLNIVLPEDNKGHGFKQRIEAYEDDKNVKVAVQKLIVLIPHSLSSPKEFNDHWVEKASTIETVVSHRAGVPNRPYPVGVYRFKNKMRITELEEPKHYYVIAECATPLLSFYEAINAKITSTPYMEELKEEIVCSFCRNLKKFIKATPGTKEKVEIVYFNDEHQKPGEILEYTVKKLWTKGILPSNCS